MRRHQISPIRNSDQRYTQSSLENCSGFWYFDFFKAAALRNTVDLRSWEKHHASDDGLRPSGGKSKERHKAGFSRVEASGRLSKDACAVRLLRRHNGSSYSSNLCNILLLQRPEVSAAQQPDITEFSRPQHRLQEHERARCVVAPSVSCFQLVFSLFPA